MQKTPQMHLNTSAICLEGFSIKIVGVVVTGLGYGVPGLGYGVPGLGYGVPGLGYEGGWVYQAGLVGLGRVVLMVLIEKSIIGGLGGLGIDRKYMRTFCFLPLNPLNPHSSRTPHLGEFFGAPFGRNTLSKNAQTKISVIFWKSILFCVWAAWF